MRCGYCHNPELVLPEKFTEPLDLDEVCSFLQERVGKLQGIVITGGEPTLRKDLSRLVKDIKDMGFKIKLDSNGTNPTMLENMMSDQIIDYVAMDIKGPLNKYSQISQRPININDIRTSINLILNSKIQHEFRTTVVKSQLDESDFKEIGETIRGAQLYSLQKFIPKKTLDPRFALEESYSESEFGDIKNMMSEYVRECIVR